MPANCPAPVVGVLAARPSAVIFGAGIYYAIDVDVEFVSDGNNWYSQGPQLLARTPAAGVALINGTQTILTYTFPNDGLLHYATVAASLKGVSGTGGQIQMSWTIDGSVTNSTIMSGGANGLQSSSPGNATTLVCDPNTAVAVKQTTALTAGSGVCMAAIVGM